MKHIGQALLAVQAALPDVRADGANPHFRSRYVTLDALLRAVRPVLNEHGVVLVQAPTTIGDGQPALRTVFLHAASGEALEETMPLFLPKTDPQGFGSALTYARRYALTALLGVAEEDDDANKASGGEPSAVRVVPPGAPVAAAGRGTEPPSPPVDDAETSRLTGRLFELADMLDARETAAAAVKKHRGDHDPGEHQRWLMKQIGTMAAAAKQRERPPAAVGP